MKSELETGISSQLDDFASQPEIPVVVAERVFTESVKRFTVNRLLQDDNNSDSEIVSERLLTNELNGNRWQLITAEFLRVRRGHATWQFWSKLLLVSLTVILLGGLLGGLYPKALRYDIDVKMLANINPNLPINITNTSACEGAHFEFVFSLANPQLIANIRIHDIDIRMLAATIQISNLTQIGLNIVYDVFIVVFIRLLLFFSSFRRRSFHSVPPLDTNLLSLRLIALVSPGLFLDKYYYYFSHFFF
jgi:hypothetical protein